MSQFLSDGGVVDATFSVESLAPGAFVITLSRGAELPEPDSRATVSTQRAWSSCSSDSSLGATISSIELAPANRPERTLLLIEARPFPWKLGTSTDVKQLRVELGRAQTMANSRPGKGNRTKRLRIYSQISGLFDAQSVSEMISVGNGWGLSEPMLDNSDVAGFQPSSEVRAVVEQHAMDAATRHYEQQGWTVDPSVARTESFDLLCTRAREVLHVEAKGTTGNGRQVLLTWREVEHARLFPRVALVVVSGIVVVRESLLAAHGGRMAVFDPRRIEECQLSATQYRCAVPAAT